MFIGSPLEEPFRLITWLVIGLPLAAVIVWLGLIILSFMLTFAALAVGVVLSMVGYVIGIPYAIYNSLTHR